MKKLRHNLSDDPFLLSQLDIDFDLTYNRLLNAFRGFVNGWFAETNKPCVVDKNRNWLGMIETVNALDPNFRMLICIRELGQIFGSIESQHRKTLLLDFPDHIAPNSAYYRADDLFNKDGVIGRPLRAIENMQDILDKTLASRLYYVTYESLVAQPAQTMDDIWQWLDLPQTNLDLQKLQIKPHESDSYYRFKYCHQTHPTLKSITHHSVSPRILGEIHKNCAWFYEKFYPELG